MLLDHVNRHRRLLGVGVFVFIGFPLVLFIPGVDLFNLGGVGGSDMPVAQVGSTPVYAFEFYEQVLQAQDQRRRFGQSATAQDLVADGTVDQILDNLVTQALVTERTKDQPVRPDETFLQERLREDPFFQNEQGEFDPARYNQWFHNVRQSNFDWETFFSNIADQVNNDSYMYLMGASARVTNAEVRDFFNDRNTRVRIRAIGIEPEVGLTEEELRAYYDENPEQFMTADERVAEFVAISTLAPVPPLVDELIAQANAGADFAELAKEHSESFDADSGGDLGWISETAGLRAHEQVLFDM